MAFMTRILLVISLCTALWACQSNPSTAKPKPVRSATAKTDLHAHDNDHARAKRLLAQAESAAPQQRLLLLLEAAELFIHSGDTAWARNIVEGLPTGIDIHPARADEFAARQALVKSLIAAEDGYYPLAYENINDSKLVSRLSSLPPRLAQSIRLKRAEYLLAMEYYSASVAERVALGELLSSTQQEDNSANLAAIWQTLMEMPLDQINAFAQNSDDQVLKGWYELASLSKDNQTNLRAQVAQVDHWVSAWPGHPASFELPADLQLLRQLYLNQPQKIALLIPKSGPLASAGNAITDGFMAAFYQMRLTETIIPEIHFYDTSVGDINAIYDGAVADGAQMIIGPISKENVTDLSLRGELPIPTLALNTVDNPIGRVTNLYQFGLGVEDEARVAAQKAWRDGHRRALLIAPQSPWGDRSVAAFTEMWQALGGELNQDYRFTDNNNYSALIKHALQLDLSEARAQEMRTLVGQIEFEPRRRQDIDMIFLAAQAQQARQVKPMLAFHYANDIPVYGTSHIYSGQPEPKQDQDMNGVRFSTLPWFFNQQSPEHQVLRQHAGSSPNLQPLYAMGVDVFHLYARLQQLEQVEQARFYGQTGALSLNLNNQIQRQPVWAEFKNGRARRLADAD